MYGVIYKITNQINGKSYVGQTTTSLSQRMASHRRANSVIGKAIRKYGWENFSVEVLEECDTKEQLNEREIFWIAALNCKTPNGYNRSDGGEGATGVECTPETRAKFSAIHKGKKQPPRSPQHCAKISAANKGKHLTPATKAKISLAMTGENNPFFGKRHTAESIARMSESHRGNTAWIGRKHRKDSKAKMSAWRRADSPFKNLLAEMDKRNMTYKDLAELLGMPQPTLPEKMRNIKGFTAVEVIKLEKIFGLPAEYLMARDDGQIFSPSKNSPFKNLLMVLDKHKITYRELGKRLGFKNEVPISQKMHGKYNFTAKDIAKLVEIFGLPAEYLMARDEN